MSRLNETIKLRVTNTYCYVSICAVLLSVLLAPGCNEHQGGTDNGDDHARYPTVSTIGWGYIDTRGRQVIPPDYSLALPFCGDWAVIGLPRTDEVDPDSPLERRAIINKSGEVIWGPEYVLWCKTYVPGVYAINDGNGIKTVYVDSATSCVLPEVIEDCVRYERRGNTVDGLPLQIKDDLIPIKMGGKWGYAAPDGEIAIACQYAHALGFSATDSVASVKTLGGRKIIIDTEGNPTSDKSYLGLSIFNEGVAFAIDDEENYYLVNTNGRAITENKFFQMTLMSGGRITAQDIQTGKWGIYDAELNEVIPPDDYESLGQFSNGLASCVDAESQVAGYLNREGKLVIQLDWDGESYQYLRPFVGDLAYVTINGKTGYINRQGEWVWDDEH